MPPPGRRHESARRSPWSIGLSGTAEERLGIATNSASSAEAIAAVAPGRQGHDADVALILACLGHLACPSGVVGRYSSHPDPAVRAIVVAHQRAPGSALEALALDPLAEIREVAIDRLAHPAPVPPMPPPQPRRR